MTSRDIIKEFFGCKKNANCILELEKCLVSEDITVCFTSMNVTKELFCQIFEKQMLCELQSKDESEKKFKSWLLERYNDFVAHLVSYLSHENEEIQVKALETLMHFVICESKHPLIKINSDEWYFPKLLFKKIILEILSDIMDQHKLIMKFKSYTSFNDIRFYTLKTIGNIFSEKVEVTDIFLYNCFFVLNSCTPTKDSSSYLEQEGVTKSFSLKKNLFSKTFSSAWNSFLKYELPISLLKKVLVVLPRRVMPHYQNVYLLTDFLTDLYNRGGLPSLLALSGLFELMQKYNVEYPDFYTKFYSLFNTDIINGKFHSTFFYLSNLFLSSTHLPAYTVAAFVKKLSRISLRSNPESLVKLLPLIRNLLIRHPVLHILLHRQEPKEMLEDPYDETATNPSETNAMESSLWEVKDLKLHFNPAVTQKEKITNELPKLEFNLADVLDTSIDSIYQNDRKRKFPEPSTNEKPAKLKNYLEFS